MKISRLLLPTLLFDKADDGGADAPSLAPPSPPDRSSTGGKPQAIPMNEGADAPTNGTPPSNDGDAGAGDSKPADAPDDMQSLRDSIRETSGALPKDRKKQDTIPYFDDVDDSDDASDTSAADEVADTSPTDDTASDDTPSDDAAATGDGDKSDDQKYYDPQVHAEGKDVFPNAYNSRQDAEFAIAAKIDRFEELAGELQEVDSEVGATVPTSIQEQIESYKDVTSLGDASDDEIRDFIVNLDMAIKSVDEKKQNVTKRYQTSKQAEQVNTKFQKAQQDASDAMANIGMDKKVNELPQNASMDDVLLMADNLISEKLQPVEQEIKDMENNTKYAKEHGQQAWLNKIRELENKKSDLESSLKQDRDKLIAYNDARLEKEQLQSKQPVKMTDKERLQKMDDVYGGWADDRSQGKFKLDMFDAPTTEPVAHFRKFAFSPKNVNKFDLTTKAGWDKMHDHWKQTMNERFSQQQQKQVVDRNRKKVSSSDEPIPQPPINDGQGSPPPGGGTLTEIQKARERIRRQSRQMFT